MSKVLKITLLLLGSLSFFSCGSQAQEKSTVSDAAAKSETPSQTAAVEMRKVQEEDITVAAARMSEYLPALEGKNVAVVANATSQIAGTHLVDTLLSAGVAVELVFAPEHGFRGTADAGEMVEDERDTRTGLKIASLHGSAKKPSPELLNGIDVVLFDIQDVGVRCYTYTSTLHYVLESCAENGVEVIVLDRPNPNGFYVDGPVLNTDFESFIGKHPVPLVHGMTIGEYAKMIVGEKWIASAETCRMSVISCLGYTHASTYELPVRPSPNLPNQASIYLYPSLVLIEGTTVSIGRGTDKPFQIVGHPDFEQGTFSFTPRPNFGAKYPKLEGKECHGIDLSSFGEFYSRESKQMSLRWLIAFYNDVQERPFFLENGFFNLLAGNDVLRQQIEEGLTEEEIRASWQEDLDSFRTMRSPYLLYPLD